jgi:hypothetical protein
MSDQSNKGPYEDRPGWASCFPPKNPNSKASFTCVVALDGQRYWVNVYERESRNGAKYAAVHVEPKQQKEKPQASS